MTWREVLCAEKVRKEAKVAECHSFSWAQTRIVNPNFYSCWKVHNIHNLMCLQKRASSALPNPLQEAKGFAPWGQQWQKEQHFWRNNMPLRWRRQEELTWEGHVLSLPTGNLSQKFF